jgi:hypothetical protein
MSIEGFPELKRRFAAISSDQATERLMGELGLLAVAEAKTIYTRQSKKTGNLGRTIRLGTVTADSANIIAGGIGGIGYARYVEFGTAPHQIRPRNKKALRWSRNQNRLTGSPRSGATDLVFATVVNHPGTRAKPYLRSGAEEALYKAGLAEAVVTAWNKAA